MNVSRPARLVTVLLPLLAAPALVQADARPDPQMDACIQAFVASNVEKDHPVSVRRLASFDNPVGTQARSQTIHLSARYKQSGKRVAQATCVIAGDEVVLTMHGKPVLSTKLAQVEPTRSTR